MGSNYFSSLQRLQLLLEGYTSKKSIGVAPITQVTHVRNKNSNIQGRSLNVKKVFSNL